MSHTGVTPTVTHSCLIGCPSINSFSLSSKNVKAGKDKFSNYHHLFRASSTLYKKEPIFTHAVQGCSQLGHISFTVPFPHRKPPLCRSDAPQALMHTCFGEGFFKQKHREARIKLHLWLPRHTLCAQRLTPAPPPPRNGHPPSPTIIFAGFRLH